MASRYDDARRIAHGDATIAAAVDALERSERSIAIDVLRRHTQRFPFGRDAAADDGDPVEVRVVHDYMGDGIAALYARARERWPEACIEVSDIPGHVEAVVEGNDEQLAYGADNDLIGALRNLLGGTDE